jgi:hypothetical protein
MAHPQIKRHLATVAYLEIDVSIEYRYENIFEDYFRFKLFQFG